MAGKLAFGTAGIPVFSASISINEKLDHFPSRN
jgi:hypothetical protein